MSIYKELDEWKKRNDRDEAILANVHGITDVAEYYDLYWPNVELAPCQFAIEVFRSIAGWCDLEKDVRRGNYFFDSCGGWETETDLAPTKGEGWSFEGDKDSLEEQIDACHYASSPAFLYEEQAVLMDGWNTHQFQLRQEGIFAPEWRY